MPYSSEQSHPERWDEPNMGGHLSLPLASWTSCCLTFPLCRIGGDTCLWGMRAHMCQHPSCTVREDPVDLKPLPSLSSLPQPSLPAGNPGTTGPLQRKGSLTTPLHPAMPTSTAPPPNTSRQLKHLWRTFSPSLPTNLCTCPDQGPWAESF